MRDKDKSAKVKYVTLLIDGKEGFSATLQPGKTGHIGFNTPCYLGDVGIDGEGSNLNAIVSTLGSVLEHALLRPLKFVERQRKHSEW